MSRTTMDCETCGESYRVVDGSTMGMCPNCVEVRDSAEETKRDLPQGCTEPLRTDSEAKLIIDRFARFCIGADGFEHRNDFGYAAFVAGIAAAQDDTDEYKAVQRDRRAMDEVREYVAKSGHSFHLVFDESGWSWSSGDSGGSDRPAIIAALGESS